MGNQKRSSMLLFLSDYKNGGKTDFYTYDYNNTTKYEFEGDQTNDAPTKCLIKISHKHKHPIDTIICIVSEEVFTKRIAPANQTAFERFKAMIDEHCSEEYPDDDYKINIIPIGYNFEIPIDTNNTQDPVPESEKRHPSIYQKIEKELGLNYKTENIIYIDYTGGFRNINLLMIALIRYLEFNGIICKDIIYSDFQSKKIHSIRSTYNMFDMINGVSEFVGTGNARQLVDLPNKLANTTNIVKTFVKTLQDFSNAIAICDVSKIQTTIESISTAINTLENDTSDDIFVQMFKTLIPTVKEKLYIGKEPPSILDLSQWCLENNMLQQAVTIYNEKILLHYYEHYPAFIAKFSDEKKKKIDNGKGKDLCKDFNDSIICNSFKEAREALKNGNADNTTEDTESNSNILIDVLIDVIKKNWNIKEFQNYLLNKTDGTEVNREYKKTEDLYKKVEKEFKNISSNDATIVLDFLEKEENLLWRAMKYYHAVRIIRNNINHVSGDMRNKNKTMQEYLEKKGLGDTAIATGETFKFKLKKDFISETLKAAIEFSKEICKN
jgi:hypothetical protein